MKPINRKEMFLEALANGCECPIEPATREEMFIKKIAERESGGVSWDKVTDKPFGTVYNKSGTLFEEQEITPIEDSTWFKTHFGVGGRNLFAEGELYLVEWDGVEYICEAYSPDSRSDVRIGSTDESTTTPQPVLDGEYPFCIFVETVRHPIAGTNYFLTFLYFDNKPHTVAIYNCTVSEDVLDEKRIPETIARTSDVVTAPASAEVGQMLAVKAVDKNGKPTKWEPADNFSGSWNDLTGKPFENLVVAQWEASSPKSGDEAFGYKMPAGRPAPYLAIKVADAPDKSVDLVGLPFNGQALKLYNESDTAKILFPGNVASPDVIVCYESGNHTVVGYSFTADAGIYVTFCDDTYGYDAKHFENGGMIGYLKELDKIYLPKAAAVADVTDAPTAENFNALLASLRAAGYLAE